LYTLPLICVRIGVFTTVNAFTILVNYLPVTTFWDLTKMFPIPSDCFIFPT
jgi:hypothetical protein